MENRRGSDFCHQLENSKIMTASGHPSPELRCELSISNRDAETHELNNFISCRFGVKSIVGVLVDASLVSFCYEMFGRKGALPWVSTPNVTENRG